MSKIKPFTKSKEDCRHDPSCRNVRGAGVLYVLWLSKLTTHVPRIVKKRKRRATKMVAAKKK